MKVIDESVCKYIDQVLIKQYSLKKLLEATKFSQLNQKCGSYSGYVPCCGLSCYCSSPTNCYCANPQQQIVKQEQGSMYTPPLSIMYNNLIRGKGEVPPFDPVNNNFGCYLINQV